MNRTNLFSRRVNHHVYKIRLSHHKPFFFFSYKFFYLAEQERMNPRQLFEIFSSQSLIDDLKRNNGVSYCYFQIQFQYSCLVSYSLQISSNLYYHFYRFFILKSHTYSSKSKKSNLFSNQHYIVNYCTKYF